MRTEDPLQSAVDGDPDALRRLVSEWMPTIRRWALLEAGDPVVAEDGVQEALVRLCRHIGQVDPTRPFGPWLRTVVRNAVRSESSRQGRRSRREAPLADVPAASHRGPERLDLAWARRMALEAFATLSPRQREIFDLVDLQGVAPKEVAERLDLSAGAVRGQLFDARRALREHLVRHPELLALLRTP